MPLLSRRRLYTRSNAALYVPAGGSGGGGGGTVLFDSSSGTTLSASGTTATFNASTGGLSLNVGNGPNGTANRALVVALFFPSAAPGTVTSPSGSWDGVPLTFLGGPYSGGGNSDMFLFGMTAPNLGTKDLVFNWTTAAVAGVMTLSVVGAFQTVGSAFHGIINTTGTSATPTVTVSAALANEITFAAFMTTSVFTTTTKTTIGTNSAAAISSFAACWTRSAAPVMDFSSSPSAPFAAAGVAIVGA